MKDLEPAEVRLALGRTLAEVRLEPNEWKHDAGLRLHYEGVSLLRTMVVGVPVGPSELGSLILDDLLPHEGGVRHELAFHGGVIEVICSDLVAAWEPS